VTDRSSRPQGRSTDFPSRRLRVRGVDTFLYDVGAGEVPTVCVHGNPDSADTWAPLLARAGQLGRVIAPDLPCFGRSERASPAVFDASLDAYVEWFAAFIDALEVPRYHLVVHDWGSLAMAAAARRPERLGGLVAIDTVPLSAQYRWHWIARWLWRPPIVGEVGMTVFNRFMIKALTRLQRPGFKALDPDLLDRFQRDLDPGMKRAILRLYRTADRSDLGRHGEGLGALGCPALIIWGAQDPYVRVEEMDVLKAALAGPVETRVVDGGHWPMFDTDEVLDRAADFITTILDQPAEGACS
jgi:pimeloyl-ACP methyl ester carboxylesterase